MAAPAIVSAILTELRSLPMAERLQLVEDLWDSISEDQDSLPDSPAVIAEVRARKARFMANPASGLSWDETKSLIRSGPYGNDPVSVPGSTPKPARVLLLIPGMN